MELCVSRKILVLSMPIERYEYIAFLDVLILKLLSSSCFDRRRKALDRYYHILANRWGRRQIY